MSMGKDKYIDASRIATDVLTRVIQLCKSGEFIRDICRFGDSLITEKVSHSNPLTRIF